MAARDQEHLGEVLYLLGYRGGTSRNVVAGPRSGRVQLFASGATDELGKGIARRVRDTTDGTRRADTAVVAELSAPMTRFDAAFAPRCAPGWSGRRRRGLLDIVQVVGPCSTCKITRSGSDPADGSALWLFIKTPRRLDFPAY